MESLPFKPEKAQRTAAIITWFILFLILLIPGIILAMLVRYPGNAIIAWCTAGWTVFMLIVLWYLPLYYKNLGYAVEEEIVRGNRGVFWKKRVTVPYTKVTNVDITQGPLQRALNVGHIHIQTAGASGSQGGPPELKLEGIRDLEGVKDLIMERVKRHMLKSAGEAKIASEKPSDSETLSNILEELKAIRGVLSK